jgi:hypothetical protein
MINARRFVVLTALALGLLTGCDDPPTQAEAPVNRRDVKPPSGPEFTGEVCVVVRNRAPFTITGRVLMKTRERATFRIGRNQTKRLCNTGTTYGNYTVSFVLTSFVTIPIFSCYTTTAEVIDVFAYKNGDNWLYNVSCH